MIFPLNLRDSKSSQVSRIRLRILGVLSNAVIWMVSTRPPTFKSSRPFNNHLLIVPKAPIIIIIIINIIIIIVVVVVVYTFSSFSYHAWPVIFLTWFSEGVNLFRSPGLFSVFKPILVMLWSIRSRFFLWFPLPPLPNLWGPFQECQLQLVSLSFACYPVVSVLQQSPCICQSFRFLSLSHRTSKSIWWHAFFSC